MNARLPGRNGAGRGGFTLAEVAVTLLIVGIALLMVIQGLNTSKMTAAQTRNMRLARELGLLTLGQIESGLFEDGDLEGRGVRSYAEVGEPDFYWEVALGDETFEDEYDPDDDRFDAWAPKEDEEEKDKNKDEETEQEWEEVKIRVTFPKILDFSNELTFERWIPWEQVYPKEKDAKAADDGGAQG